MMNRGVGSESLVLPQGCQRDQINCRAMPERVRYELRDLTLRFDRMTAAVEKCQLRDWPIGLAAFVPRAANGTDPIELGAS
jgi:hypothetical protein